ncbi:SPW repeat domain-containing protein, partial [Nostoc linckia]|uniref:SPW repeat domain-containing protein n=1 Tax=Nostoc linckia TaxID=92942 RepID=UPI001C556C89
MSSMLPLIPTRIHGVIDYLWGVVAVASAYIFGFANQGAAHWLLMAAGVATLGISLLTNYEVALVRLLPMRLHLAVDVAMGLFLTASPWLFGLGDREAAAVLGLGFTSILAGLTTHTRAMIAAEQQERTRPEQGGPGSRTLATDRVFALAVTAVGLAVSVAFGWSAMIDIVQQNAADTRQIGAPVPWQLNFSLPHTPVQDALFRLHNLLFVISIGITLLVT